MRFFVKSPLQRLICCVIQSFNQKSNLGRILALHFNSFCIPWPKGKDEIITSCLRGISLPFKANKYFQRTKGFFILLRKYTAVTKKNEHNCLQYNLSDKCVSWKLGLTEGPWRGRNEGVCFLMCLFCFKRTSKDFKGFILEHQDFQEQ